ncbi:MAG: DISARM system SNF2-like helicase DrmD [Candidatus Competibacteraceae bacterium]
MLNGTTPIPTPGDLVRARSRTYLVEAVEADRQDPKQALVRLACLDDDAQGESLEILWGLELDTAILDQAVWQSLGQRGFDPPRLFGAYFHTLRWNCVTATNPGLFQAPFRAGIRIDAYQLEPLRKALRLPRVNLFIADDVGLGKTIEAGLIATELRLRRRVQELVVSCPPSMLLQWKEELESRFGLTFEVLDRTYVERVRRERGYGVNPWTTFPRFLISHRLLIDEAYAAPLRDWLGQLRPGTLLILDEAHHAAPASGVRYAIDSRFTRAIRDLAPRFEHRLFLSATPHNGHSNSFSALLEILDPHRFTRGVRVLKSALNEVMVRRLKDDLREVAGGFPKRVVHQIELDGLPETAPELALSRRLDDYRQLRQQRYRDAGKREQAQAALLISGLQQRLLSSIDAFARTLKVHRRTMERLWARELSAVPRSGEALRLLVEPPDADDDRSQLPESEQAALLEQAVEQATLATASNDAGADIAGEHALLEILEQLADAGRDRADARVRYLIGWLREHLCPGIRLPGDPCFQPAAPWSTQRVLIFTEYEDTLRYLLGQLRAAVADTDRAEQRIEIFHGPTPPERREAIKHAFNQPPEEHPLRILLATDAAREGLNLQAHCQHLFHFDVPWNPSRLEQRNGRIDRKLQPAPEVHCYYFVYVQRPEDQVLRALVRKTDTIRQELGSLAQVLSSQLAETLKAGISRTCAAELARRIDTTGIDPDRQQTVVEELEAARERQEALRQQIDGLRQRLNEARRWIGLETGPFREALNSALELLGARPLQATATPPDQPQRYSFPDLDTRRGADPAWCSTLDTLRVPAEAQGRTGHWREPAPLRPVVFAAPNEVDDDTVQLHLSHRLVQRLLARFQAQGYVHHDLSRACLAQTTDAIPRLVMLGRLSLYGRRAVRLHEEILTVTARWIDPARRQGGLNPYGREAESKTLELLEQALRPNPDLPSLPPEIAPRLLAALPQDVADLLPHLEGRGAQLRREAEAQLARRGEIEAASLRTLLEEQSRRVQLELGKGLPAQLTLAFDDAERRQLEANRRYWQRWLADVEQDLSREPARIREFYQVVSARLEPVGIAYLWPITG